MGDERGRRISHATGELREYAGVLDGYRDQLSDVEQALNEGKVTPEMWGVHESVQVFPANPNADQAPHISYGRPDAPDALVAFRNSYEAAHDALTVRLGKIARAIEQDASKYRLIADRYDEDERENLAEIYRSMGHAVIPRTSTD